MRLLPDPSPRLLALLLAGCVGAACRQPADDGDTDDTAPSDTQVGDTDPSIPDEDGDGRGDQAFGGSDCDDNDGTVFPGAPEIPADGIDQDCDGQDLCFVDGDRDGFGAGVPVVGPLGCDAPGLSPLPTDCRDDDDTISPAATEVCDGVDRDCSGLIDDPDDPPEHWLDRDDDGFGDPASVYASCERPPGYVAAGARDPDCDDFDPRSRPGALEIPGDGKDQDCDGVDACWPDGDSDGFGDPDQAPRPGSTLACTGFGDAPNKLDCDDGDDTIYPNAPEACGTVDRDCDGTIGDEDDDVPEEARLTVWRDEDGDGHGDPLVPIYDCVPDPDTTAPDPDDCNDDLPTVFLGAPEVCNGIDDDCDDKVDNDDDDVTNAREFHADRDGDLYGDPNDFQVRCFAAYPYTTTDDRDCDDTSSFRNPGRTELAGNVLDEDCDGNIRCYVDGDLDGAAGPTTGELPVDTFTNCDVPGFARTISDCDDEDASVQLLVFYADVDNDTWGNANSSIRSCNPPQFHTDRAGDCDDFSAQVHPGAPEVPGNLRDDDCDDVELCFVDADGDGDGVDEGVPTDDLFCNGEGESYTADDCDDDDPTAFPGAPEVLADGVDQDCDGGDTCFRDGDGDGAGVPILARSFDLSCDAPGLSATADDCDDDDEHVFPGAVEACNDIDDDCDDRIDDADDDVAIGLSAWWFDGDRDGLGDPAQRRDTCQPPGEDWIDQEGDCDDTRALWGTTCPWEDVAVADGWSCGLRTDGTVACAGPGLSSAVPVPDGAFTALVADGGLACGLDDEGLLRCWGDDTDPRWPGDPVEADVIALGPGGLCWTSQGALTCTGALAGTTLPPSDGWTALAVATDHLCAIDGAGLACAGTVACPQPAASSPVDLRLDDEVTCVLDARGAMACDGCAGPRLDDAPDGPLSRVADLSLGAAAACAVGPDGALVCWDDALPAAPDVSATRVDVGPGHACLIDPDAVITCWGADAASVTPPSPPRP